MLKVGTHRVFISDWQISNNKQQIQGGIHVYYPKYLWRTPTISEPQWRTGDLYESVGSLWREIFDHLGAIFIYLRQKHLLFWHNGHRDLRQSMLDSILSKI